MPPAPSYRQSREPVAAKESLCRAAALDSATESPKTKRYSSKGGAPQGS